MLLILKLKSRLRSQSVFVFSVSRRKTYARETHSRFTPTPRSFDASTPRTRRLETYNIPEHRVQTNIPKGTHTERGAYAKRRRRRQSSQHNHSTHRARVVSRALHRRQRPHDVQTLHVFARFAHVRVIQGRCT